MARTFNRNPSVVDISLDSSLESTNSNSNSHNNNVNNNKNNNDNNNGNGIVFRRGKNEFSNCSPNRLHNIYKTTAMTTETNQTVNEIQELQNLMDIQNDKLNNIKTMYSQQNSKLAKTNSSLLMKVTDLERMISDLVKENILLRSETISSKKIHNEKLNDTIQLLVNGLSQKFDEIFYMINVIREKENLPVRHESEVKNKRYSYRSRNNSMKFDESINDKNTTTISCKKNKRNSEVFVIPGQLNGDSMPENHQILPKRRKKSSRRDSFVLINQEEFSNVLEDETPEKTDLGNHTNNELNNVFKENLINQINEEPELRDESLNESNSFDIELLGQENDDLPTENSFAFNNSIIEYSIPEESMQNSIKESVEESSSKNSSVTSSQKLQIFNDNSEDPELHDTAFSSSLSHNQNSSNTENELVFVQLPSQNKIKHSMKPLKSKGKNKMIDEVMPSNSSVVTDELPTSRNRRTRGKAVDYKLPSLRSKMRRPTEQFVDATTVTDIHDLQVNGKGKKLRRKKGGLKKEGEEVSIKLESSVVSFPDVSNTNTNSCKSSNHTEDKLIQNPNKNVTPLKNKAQKEITTSGQDISDFLNVANINNTSWPTETSPLLEKTRNLHSETTKKRVKSLKRKPISNNNTALKKRKSLNTILDSNDAETIVIENSPSLSIKKPKSALKDVTNTRTNKTTKTKVLLKKAIVNDLHDENSPILGEIKSIANKDASSFRLNEEDLSVFDFMGLNKKKQIPKTYRSNNRK